MLYNEISKHYSQMKKQKIETTSFVYGLYSITLKTHKGGLLITAKKGCCQNDTFFTKEDLKLLSAKNEN